MECMKAMALFLCPRCLVVKGDVPHIGKDFDINRRKSKPRIYSHENVEAARKAIFNLGRSVGYKGEYDPLKIGSWAPTRVRSLLVFVLGLLDRHRSYRMHTILSSISIQLR
jgi:hypothetical protein